MAKTLRTLTANRPPPLNHLLAALPPTDYTRLAPHLTVVPLILKQFLYRPGERIEHVYFPGGGFASVVTMLSGGGMVEVATIGREGMIGASAILDGEPSVAATMVQAVTDTCYKLPVSAFRRELQRQGPLYDLMTRYHQALIGFIMQSTACNALHSVEERLARWLLLAHDRIGRDDFPLTQEFVAMMLGRTRPAVTVVARELQSEGLIQYRHGHITIVDRKKLEASSCECYSVVTKLMRAVTRTP